MALIVDDVTSLVNQPATGVDSSHKLVQQVSKLVIDWDMRAINLIVKVAHALMWIEVELFDSVW